MKKPSLRFRQVFEHPTHFKVKSPMGNPITIAKSAISPSMQARLRKYADGTSDEPVAPPTPEEAQVARSWEDIIALPKAEQPAAIRTEMYRRRVEQAAPIITDVPTPEALDAIQTQRVAEDAAAAGLPLPADMPPAAAPSAVVPVPATEPVAEPVAEPAERRRYRPFDALGSVAPKPATEPAAEPAAPAEAPAAEPTVEQRLRTDVDKAHAERQAEIKLAQETALKQADQAKLEADKYQEEHDRWLAKAEASRGIQEQASTDLAAFKNQGSYLSRLSTMSQIGTALSLAAGAFATGMTGMPNFALQIYNNAVEKDLEKQREDRNSLWNRFVQAGNSAEHADQYVRASMDKAVAARAAQQAALTKNATAAQGLAKLSADMNLKAEAEIQKIKKEAALEAQARAQAAVLEGKPQQAQLAAVRQAEQDEEARAAREREEARKNEELKLKKSGEARQWKELNLKEKEAVGYQEPGVVIPEALKGAKPEVIRQHRVEFQPIDGPRQIGFLIDPKTRKDFIEYSRGFTTVNTQAENLADWAAKHPTGLVGVFVKDGPSEALQQRAALEARTKTMIEGYIKNVTGIKRASNAAIEYMQGVVKDPAELKNLVDQFANANYARFNEIIKEIKAGQNELYDSYLEGGKPPAPAAFTPVTSSGQVRH